VRLTLLLSNFVALPSPIAGNLIYSTLASFPDLSGQSFVHNHITVPNTGKQLNKNGIVR
jgi:hypothetical protein